MSNLIAIDLGYLLDLRSDVDRTAGLLRDDVRDHGGTPSDPRIDSRLGKFRGDWDKRRGELADTLDSVSAALTAIHDSFEGTDAQLAAELEGGGS